MPLQPKRQRMRSPIVQRRNAISSEQRCRVAQSLQLSTFGTRNVCMQLQLRSSVPETCSTRTFPFLPSGS